MNIFNILIEQPIINVLVAIYQGLMSLHVPYAFGFSIIGLSVLIRLIISPFMAAQLRHSKKMQEMAPHIAKIKEKHKGDAMKQNAAQAEFLKEQGVNPLAGCLPALLQFPIIIGLFVALRKISHLSTTGEINKLLYFDSLKLKQIWDTHLYGIPVDKTPKELLPTFGVAILGIVLVTALLQLVQALMMPGVETPQDTEKSKKDTPDFSTMMQKQMLFFIPILLGYSSFTLPIGLSIYWNTFSFFGIVQQYRVSGWGRMSGLFSRFNK